ncbi:PREDICTED: regulatory protein NPR1 isoform X2 [Camelina sativa]|uniref:Regulatory protein NPR1 isoform X2 n=1 Tax=Camelina sativa TaxID=90675 RepID=A0ABM0TSF5_CAMSA|nr:PREDICTED: regulatory protein NPR1 isoform X2 [Camelina sativa]
MDTILDGFADSYEITSNTSFFAAAPAPTGSSIVYPPAAELLTGPDVSALRLLSNSLESVFDSPEDFYSDAKLVLSDGREVSFHRCVVSARSPFFKNALAAAKKEKDSNAAVVKLELKEIAKDYEVGFDSVVTVLAYVYSSRVRPPPKGVSECADHSCCHVACRPAVDFRLEVLYLAFIFKIPELVTLYQRHLLDVVDKVVIEDALVILKLACICGKSCTKLLDRCKEIIVKSDVDIVSLDKSLPEEIVKQITNNRKELGYEVPQLEKHVWNIHKALDSDDVALVEMLLKEGHTSLDDACALHFAVAYCDVKTATDLLDLKIADVNHRNPRGYTVLHVAAMRKEPQLILSLLEKGASASETTLEGRTALLIAKRATMAVEYNNVPERYKHSLKGRLCIEILEQGDKREPIPRDVPPSLVVAADELKTRLLDLENRVALAQLLFPTEAQVAMDIAQVKGTCEFIGTSLEPDGLTGTKRTSPDVKIVPFKILEEHQSRLKALSKTVELGKRFLPRCSAVLDQIIMDCEDLTQLAWGEEETPENRLQKRQRFMEIQESVNKAFTEDNLDFVNSSLTASSSSTSKSTAGKRSNRKLSHRRSKLVSGLR